MSTSFRLRTERSGNELTVVLSGDFDGDSAWELANLLMLQHDQAATVRIDTRQVGKVVPFGAALLKNLLSLRLVRTGRIFLDGMAVERAAEGGHRLFGGVKGRRPEAVFRSRASIR